MGHFQNLRMERAKRAFKEEIFPTDLSRSFYVDCAGNTLGFVIERQDGGILAYNGETGRYEPFEVLPEDGAVNIPPYDYKDGKIVSVHSENPQESPKRYACYYARYFCGEFMELITEKEYKQLETTGELYQHDTLDYAPVFDGKIYPTLSESAAAQIKAFGYHYGDDRRKKPSLAERIAAAEEKKDSTAKESPHAQSHGNKQQGGIPL